MNKIQMNLLRAANDAVNAISSAECKTDITPEELFRALQWHSCDFEEREDEEGINDCAEILLYIAEQREQKT